MIFELDFVFLLFIEDDIILNSRVFNWPRNISNMIEMSNSRIFMRQDQIEAELRRRLIDFDARVLACSKELDALRNRDPQVGTFLIHHHYFKGSIKFTSLRTHGFCQVLSVDEMKISLQILDKLSFLLEDAKRELQVKQLEEVL